MASLAHDTQKRRNNIARLWAEDGVFVDHNSRYEGHSGIDHAVAGLVEKFPNFVFTERGELQAFNGVGKLDWGFGPAGEEVVITGIDVLVMRGDTIGALYTFPDVPQKELWPRLRISSICITREPQLSIGPFD